jgi:adenosylcobinamide-GDP ribazoletransferase
MLTPDRKPMSHALMALAQCVRFYSRLPVPRLPGENDPHAAPDFKRVPRLLPLASILIGLPSFLMLLGAGAAGMGGLLSAALAITVAIITTGGMAEDGLSDVADGFGGGHTVERRLEIMADSRVGAYGAAAMVMALMIRVIALGNLVDFFGYRAGAAALLAACVLSRIAGLMPLVFLPSARPGGKSSSVGRPTAMTIAIALILAVGIVAALLALGGFKPRGIAIGILISLLSALPMIALSQRMIGGQTGDVAGATQQVAEIVFLVTLFVA